MKRIVCFPASLRHCLFKLQQINRIKHLLDRKTLLLVIIPLFLVNFNSVQLFGVIPATETLLQKVQNFAGRIIPGTKKV